MAEPVLGLEQVSSVDLKDSTGFYRAFEDRYRGSRATIKQRVRVYLPFVTPLLALYPAASTVDLGCGRGEWLELLQEAGFSPQGVDLDEYMLQACVERGLPARQGEAVGYLRSLESASQCIVSGFHIAEHMAFADLQTLVVEALRVLKPGGLLILETPNPENLVVGASSFYLDPTHLRPLPPLLLSFLPEQVGYARVKILRLQAPFDLESSNEITLFDVLDGVSQDYAVVAQKGAASALLALFDTVFEQKYGVEQNDLACRYDKRIFERMGTLDRQVGTLDRRMDNAEAQTRALSDALSCIANLHEQLRQVEHQASVAEARARALGVEKTAIMMSLSWRLTAPLRWVGGVAMQGAFAGRRLANRWRTIRSHILERPLAAAMRFVLRHPALSHRLNQRLMRYPALYQPLLGVARRYGVMSTPRNNVAFASARSRFDCVDQSNMTPRARLIYHDLKAAIESRRLGTG